MQIPGKLPSIKLSEDEVLVATGAPTNRMRAGQAVGKLLIVIIRTTFNFFVWMVMFTILGALLANVQEGVVGLLISAVNPKAFFVFRRVTGGLGVSLAGAIFGALFGVVVIVVIVHKAVREVLASSLHKPARTLAASGDGE